jgi:hypothetical protein
MPAEACSRPSGWASLGEHRKEIADAAIYAIVSALVFGWLWPH